MTAEQIAFCLKSIGFVVGTAADDRINVIPPSWRHDVSRDVDLIEDIARPRGNDTLSDPITALKPTPSRDVEGLARATDHFPIAPFRIPHPQRDSPLSV